MKTYEEILKEIETSSSVFDDNILLSICQAVSECNFLTELIKKVDQRQAKLDQSFLKVKDYKL
jgi:hypothetical protein